MLIGVRCSAFLAAHAVFSRFANLSSSWLYTRITEAPFDTRSRSACLHKMATGGLTPAGGVGSQYVSHSHLTLSLQGCILLGDQKASRALAAVALTKRLTNSWRKFT